MKAVALVALFACRATVDPTPLPQLRETLPELEAGARAKSPVGSSFLAGVQTQVLVGDPSTTGFYSILLFVPAHTTIAAHAHRDSRIASVLHGTWHFGYGEHFSADTLTTLPPGSVYTEPGGMPHFAQTGDEAVVVHLTGSGPTDTVFTKP